MMDVLSKAFFKTLAKSGSLERLASRYGMRKPTSFARRFVAGETLDEALPAARVIAGRGMLLTLDQLGEGVDSLAQADEATRVYLDMVRRIVDAGVERNISLKLTQLGLNIDRASCTDNLRKILEGARGRDFFIRIDMEDSPTVQATIDTHATLWDHGSRNVGLVIQAALYRSEDDLRRLNTMGVRVRLVKGAYKEPASVAHQKKSDVDAAFVRLTRALLTDGAYPAIGTHDPAMIAEATSFAAARGISKDSFEFQMLYGIRRDLQAALHAEGYRVRVYVPFGQHWFPYFMRRLGERPANIAFLLKGIFGERSVR